MKLDLLVFNFPESQVDAQVRGERNGGYLHRRVDPSNQHSQVKPRVTPGPTGKDAKSTETAKDQGHWKQKVRPIFISRNEFASLNGTPMRWAVTDNFFLVL